MERVRKLGEALSALDEVNDMYERGVGNRLSDDRRLGHTAVREAIELTKSAIKHAVNEL